MRPINKFLYSRAIRANGKQNNLYSRIAKERVEGRCYSLCKLSWKSREWTWPSTSAHLPTHLCSCTEVLPIAYLNSLQCKNNRNVCPWPRTRAETGNNVITQLPFFTFFFLAILSKLLYKSYSSCGITGAARGKFNFLVEIRSLFIRVFSENAFR